MSASDQLPVVVIGAGPIGLSAAVNLLDRGLHPIVLEAGDRVAANIRQWAHVRLFSPWSQLVDPVAERLLAEAGWTHPDPELHPLGGELVEDYLEPLASLPEVADVIRLDHRVIHVTRQGIDKVKSEGRDRRPFVVVVDSPYGEVRIAAAAVVDASGTWNQPNPAGAGGIPAVGEANAAEAGRIRYDIPDVLGAERAAFAGRRVAVIGSGHSAQNAVRDLDALRREAPETSTAWLVRRTEPGSMFGDAAGDALAARGALGNEAHRLASGEAVDFILGFGLEEVVDADGGVQLVSSEGVKAGPFDVVIATTGARPDFDLARELRLDLDPGVESSRTLASLIDPNIHDCGSVPPHGVVELAHPEVGYYPIGIKSYGRAPTFLLLTGYEQARSVVAEIAGDHQAARRVELVLPGGGCDAVACEPSDCG